MQSHEVTDRPGVSSDGTTFYTIADARFFPGLVGLLNSLRVTGHQQQLVVLDAGLTASQRKVLEPHCILVERPSDPVPSPTFFKPYAHLLSPKGTAVIMDSDMVVTRSLKEVVATAGQGKICAFPDPVYDRWSGEWEELFDLPGPPRRQPYVSAHLVAVSTEHWPDFLGRWWRACQGIGTHPTVSDGAPGGPTPLGDQDALNALLMSELPRDALALLPPEERPNSGETWWVKVVDAQTLSCTLDGRSTMIIHYDGTPKPWEARARKHVRYDAYVRLLKRLYHSTDVVLRFPAEDELPLWMRTGKSAHLSLRVLDVVNSIKAISLRSRPFKMIAKRILPRSLFLRLRGRVRALRRAQKPH